tara:strand:+ start:982 stop:1533 length:552 start_codon:yes stop_codon:yes gene_type:complete
MTQNTAQPEKKATKKSTRRRVAKKRTAKKRVAKKKAVVSNTAPYPAEYRQKVVAMILGLPFERAKESIAQRKLTVIPTTAWDWKRTYEKSGPEALVPKRTHVRDVAGELKRLADVATTNLRPIRAQAVNGNGKAQNGNGASLSATTASGSIDSVRKVLELHNEHPDVFDPSAVIALITRIVGI